MSKISLKKGARTTSISRSEVRHAVRSTLSGRFISTKGKGRLSKAAKKSSRPKAKR